MQIAITSVIMTVEIADHIPHQVSPSYAINGSFSEDMERK